MLSFFTRPLYRLLKIPSNTSLIWWLLEVQKAPRRQILSVIGILLIYGGLFFIQTRTLAGAISLSVNLLIGMTLHESGHWVFFPLNGIRGVIRFLFPLGAIAAPVSKEEDARSDMLPWWNIGWLIQGGPAMNVLLMVVGHLIVRLDDPIAAQFGRDMILLNGWLAISNLFPLGKLDAGQLYHCIFSSLEERFDHLVAWLVTAVSLGIVGWVAWSMNVWTILGNLLTNFGLVLFFLLLPASIWHAQKLDKPEHANSRQAMSKWQAAVHIAVHLTMVIAALRLM
jgi:Zn-dependent protease